MATVRSSCVGSGAAVAIVLLVTLVIGVEASAHRLDEYLQAARIGVDSRLIELDLDLTPGVAVADAIIADVDRDRDGSLSPEEQRAYAAEVLSAIRLAVDGRPLQVQSLASSFPDLEAVRRGEGVIRLRSNAVLPHLPEGDHELFFRNAHRDDVSVYLANALVPESDRIAITAQRRDGDQRALTIEYVIRPNAGISARVLLFGGLAGVGAVAALLMRRSRAA